MQVKKVIRSKRKTIALQICDDATLIVRAPFGVSKNIIRHTILKHHKWLENKKREILSRNLILTKRKFVNGELFLYMGKSYPLKMISKNDLEEPLFLDVGYFYLQENVIHRREIFVSWYKRAAYEKISQRIHWYALKRGLIYNDVKISNAQKQWGSCTHLSNLNFTWRLIMAPLPVIDYVVVHELVHLVEKNHSPSFWNQVRFILPDYKIQKYWLSKNEHLLRL